MMSWPALVCTSAACLVASCTLGTWSERAPTFASRANFSRSCLSLVSDSGTKWLQPSIVTSRFWAKAGGTRYARIPASPAVVRLTNCRRVTRFIHASPLEHSVCGEESQETEPVVLAKTGPKIGQIQDARQERSIAHDQSQFEKFTEELKRRSSASHSTARKRTPSHAVHRGAKTYQPLDVENPLR